MRKGEDEKPIIMIGQGECIYKQFLFSRKHWALPDGTIPPMPKDEEQGVMLSSFVSRKFGYGLNLLPVQLDHVNQYRLGQHYLDVESVMAVNESQYLPLHLLHLIFNMEQIMTDIGTTTPWCCSSKILQMYSLAFTETSMSISSILIIHPDTTAIAVID